MVAAGERDRQRKKTNARFRTWQPETSSGEETSGGAVTLHTPALEASAVSLSAGVRPRATGSGGGKTGNRDNGKESVERQAQHRPYRLKKLRIGLVGTDQ